MTPTNRRAAVPNANKWFSPRERRLPKFLLVTLLATVGGPVWASEVTAEQIAAAVSRLGSRSFAEREAAARTLDAIGEPALPRLQRAAGSTDPEVRRRAGELLQAIQRRVESARLTAARRVRLVYQDVSLDKAAADFNQKTGFSVRVQGDPKVLQGRTVTLDTGEGTLWQALDQFCRAAGLAEWRSLPESARSGLKPFVAVPAEERKRLEFLPPSWGWPAGRPAEPLVLVPAPFPALPSCETGGIRVRAMPHGTPGWGQTAGTRELHCLLEISAQPGLDWQAAQEVRIEQAVDEQGQRLAAGPMETPLPAPSVVLAWRIAAMKSAEMYGSLTRPANPTVEVRLEAGEKPSRRLKRLEGTVIGRVMAPPQVALTVENVLKAGGKTFQGGPTSLRVGQVKTLAGNHFLVEVEITHLPDENEATAENSFFPGSRFGPGDLRLRDAAGKEFELAQGTLNAIPANGPALVTSLTVLYRAGPGQGEPAKLVLYNRRPTFVEVPFRLENVPLP